MDFVEIVNGKRRNSLAGEIRRELRTGSALAILGLFAFMCFLIALEYRIVEPDDMVFLLLAAIFVSSFRFNRREKLLRKAARALESKDD